MASINNATAQAREKKAGKQNNAAMRDIESLIQAGINPVTGLPLKTNYPYEGARKSDIKKNIRVLDEQDAINRYRWYNLPLDMSSADFERLLYYKGQLAFFYMEGADEFYAMPYALDGGIDFYGRFISVHPIPFAEGVNDAEKMRIAAMRNYLSTLKLNCIYDVIDSSKISQAILTNSCVLLHDYSPQLSQTIIPRAQLQDSVIDIMADLIPFMRTALLNSTGVQGMRVQTEDEQSNVAAASASINRAALNGEKYMAIVGSLDFQDLTGGDVAKSEEFLLAMQALDNFRLSLYGIDNGGLFEKKAHKLQSEQEMNGGNTGLIYEDGLARRRHFCDICNSIWDLGMWCDMPEALADASPILAPDQPSPENATGEEES